MCETSSLTYHFVQPGTDMHLVPVMAVGKVYSNSESCSPGARCLGIITR